MVLLEQGTHEHGRQNVRRFVSNAQFFIRDEFNRKVFGRVIEFTSYMGAYGAVVAYPTGEAGFWGLDYWTKKMIYLGEAPPLPRMGVEDRGHELDRIVVKAVAGPGSSVLETSRSGALRVVQPVGEIDQRIADIAALYPPKPPETVCETPSVQTTLVSKARSLWQR